MFAGPGVERETLSPNQQEGKPGARVLLVTVGSMKPLSGDWIAVQANRGWSADNLAKNGRTQKVDNLTGWQVQSQADELNQGSPASSVQEMTLNYHERKNG